MHSSYFLHDRVSKYWSTEFFILANTGSNQAPSFKKRFYHVKIKSLEVTSLQELGQWMDQLQRQAFRKTWKNLGFGYDKSVCWSHCIPRSTLRLAAKVLHVWDFQLVPTVEEFEGILGCPLGGRKPYLFSGLYPSMARVAKVVKISAQELDRVKQNRNGVVGISKKHLEEKAKALADQGNWTSFVHVLAFLVFEVVLFPNLDGLVDLVVIDVFLAYHHSKESLVVGFGRYLWHIRPKMREEQCKNCLLHTRSLCMAGLSHFTSWK